jgi:hypothetical protein
VIRTAIELLDKQEDIYQGKLGELQQAASICWEASQRGEVVDGNIAIDMRLTLFHQTLGDRLYSRSLTGRSVIAKSTHLFVIDDKALEMV